ncbi:MAG: aldolase catalytic domain-containing protein [Clostridiaceae bacterium]|nr:aldolase catalytic domain-containing protein [Clostridiaceae bacterium]
MGKIELLDCTLRDGGHLTDSYFGRDVIVDIISKLMEANLDIIEVGFLKNCEFNEDVACYNSISEAMKVLPSKCGNVRYSLLAQEDLYDIDQLEDCNGDIEIIRVSFHEFDLQEGLTFAEKVVKKGYQCYINPINLLGYTDEKLLEIIHQVNIIHPAGFTIVDTFGALRKSDLLRLYYLIDHNLLPDIQIALHLHENQSLSYSLAQTFIEIRSVERDVCIDGSLYGMGRVPGNLCIELIMDYMNQVMGQNYNLEPVYDAIDDYILEIKKRIPWGYSSAYALSAQHRLHRSYAEYLLSTGKLRTKQINQILSMVSPEHMAQYDEAYIADLYYGYQSKAIDDNKDIALLKEIFNGKSVLLLAPGKSIESNTDKIMQICGEVDITVSAGFIWDKIRCDYFFCTNFKRWAVYGKREGTTKKIITSNLLNTELPYDYSINYADYAYSYNRYFDNCGAMLIKFVVSMGVKDLYLAGYDGFQGNHNFAVHNMEKEYSAKLEEENRVMTRFIRDLQKELSLSFVTPSVYDAN